MVCIDLGWSFLAWLLVQGTKLLPITSGEWETTETPPPPKSQNLLQGKELIGWVVHCVSGEYKKFKCHKHSSLERISF